MVNPAPIVDELSRSKAITCPPNSVSILPDGSLLRKAIETSPDPRLLLRENLNSVRSLKNCLYTKQLLIYGLLKD